MTVEVRIDSQQMTQRVNGFELTPSARAKHELVRKDTVLKNHLNPNVQFAMSEELMIKFSKRVEELCEQLGLPKDEEARTRSIQKYKKELIEIGFSHWRILKDKDVV